MQTHHPSITHPDSPVFETINQHIHPQDSIYAHQNNMYSSSAISENALNLHTDYASDQDSRKYLQQQAKPDIFPNAHRASFTSYPNATRQRHPTTRSGLPSANQYRDSFYPTSAADIFPPAMTSPVQSHMQAFEPRSSYDFINGQVNMNGGLYNPSVNMFQSHQVNGNKPQQQQQSQHSAYAAPYSNGPHISSQTPYGPHVPAGTAAPSSIIGTTAGISGPPGLAPLPNMPVVNGSNAPANPEEISTIFVVGFPEDMQEREFQNMFTFSPDFEAATLKIPNKEYTAYGSVVGGGPASSAGLRNGTAAGYSGFTGPNDPYNLVTVNQGGVVVDTGREGTMTSWPATVSGDDINSGHFIGGALGGAGAGAAPNMPPRKQIIGFAKFKTREAALVARDGLQGRRVDIDKGAVLKAEMAKKNLHTKRGVGPVPGGGAGPTPGGGPGSSAGGLQQALVNGLGGSEQYSLGSADMMGTREREMGAIGAMGLGSNRLNQWRDQMQQEHVHPVNGIAIPEREDDDRRVGLISAMGLGSFGSTTRGPRERAEDDERERRRKEKEMMRLRAGNSTAYDAFHSVPSVPASLSRHFSNSNGNGLLSSSENEVGGTSPMMGNSHSARSIAFSHSSHSHHEEIPGPWDNIRNRGTRPRSSSQRSVSPPLPSSGNPSFFDTIPFSPSVEQQHHLQFLEQTQNDQRIHEHLASAHRPHAASESSSSSVMGGSQSAGPSAGGESDECGIEGDISRALGGLDVNADGGKTSPQLPSPASGASSRNGVDQNPPINTLYVGNLPTQQQPPSGFPQDYLEESLRELFSTRAGFRRLCFRQKNNGPMCFVEFEDVPHATKALNDLYGNNLKGLVKGGIRLSYSKNPLGVRTPTSAGSNGPSLQQQQLQSNNNNNTTNGSYPSTYALEFQPRISEEQRVVATQRRDMVVTSPPLSGHQPFSPDLLASSPPRFYSSSPSGFGTSSTPLTSMSTAFTPRYLYGLPSSVSSGHPSSTFSPFGLSNTPPPHSTIPDHQATSDDHMSSAHSQHFAHNNFAPANNLEAARAG